MVMPTDQQIIDAEKIVCASRFLKERSRPCLAGQCGEGPRPGRRRRRGEKFYQEPLLQFHRKEEGKPAGLNNAPRLQSAVFSGCLGSVLGMITVGK